MACKSKVYGVQLASAPKRFASHQDKFYDPAVQKGGLFISDFILGDVVYEIRYSEAGTDISSR